MITARQIRAARGLLGWDATDLAERANLTRETVSKIENQTVQPHEKTISSIIRTFDQNGIEFTDNSGVRLKPQNVETFEGSPGFLRFYDAVYEHLSTHGGDVCVSGVDEKLFVKYQGDFADFHMNRMADLVKRRSDFGMRILVEEDDYNFVASTYAQYRWQPKKHFSPTPFYVFGDHLALINFTHDPAPFVVLMKSACFAEAYRRSFELAWANAQEPSAIKGSQQ